MVTFKSIVKMIVIIFIVKAMFFFGSVVSKDNTVKKPAIERFLNEFVINNQEVTYPVKVDSITSLRNRKLTKEDGIYFVVEDLQMNIARETFAVPYQDLEELLKQEASPEICQHFKTDRERLFKGYSQVGLVQKYVDVNNKFVAEIKFHISSC
ncbi:hypothetical protein EXU30_18525 [Shewanella maritima]|uniref:Uncharacterized protein n=1 Tax=Shewanella maritima TaxID=2520507 RepID=A0A411PLS2_9GAMM|nr:hypothetical protein [Shewanella maritima]QBF84438.1 hypothetical protein EXU30_18525 [Shewanella maritima]